MKKLYIYLTFVLLRFCNGLKKTLPVFVMDHDGVMNDIVIEKNPFEILSQDFFTDLAIDAIKRSKCVIIFVDETLCAEDVSLKDDLGTPFYYLQKGIEDNNVIYMPAVMEPYDFLRQIFSPHSSNTFTMESIENLSDNDQKYIYVYFKDDHDVSQADNLRKHDTLMNEAYFTIRQKRAGPVLGFYTGKRNRQMLSHLRYSLEDDWEPEELDGVMVVSADAIFRLSGSFSTNDARRSAIEKTPVVESELRTRRSLSTTMVLTDFRLQFNFEFEEERWKLANVLMMDGDTEVGRATTDITAPWQRSYYCAEPITIRNRRDGSALTITEYQIEPLSQTQPGETIEEFFEQALRNSSNSNTTTTPSPSNMTGQPAMCTFSKSLNCGPYFNSHIIVGLFVSFILLVITFLGVIMIMNIGRNDRMEDPHVDKLLYIPFLHGWD